MANEREHVSREERFCIEKLLVAGDSCRDIAKRLGRGLSTVSQEIARCGGRRDYDPLKEQKWAGHRQRYKKRSCLKVALDPYLCRRVEADIRGHVSPERISSRLRFKSLCQRPSRVGLTVRSTLPERSRLAQLTPSAKDRFLALSARSQGRSRRTEKGRVHPFDAPPANDRYFAHCSRPPRRRRTAAIPQSARAQAGRLGFHRSARRRRKLRRIADYGKQVRPTSCPRASGLRRLGRKRARPALGAERIERSARSISNGVRRGSAIAIARERLARGARFFFPICRSHAMVILSVRRDRRSAARLTR